MRDGRLYCYSEKDGTCVLIEASPKSLDRKTGRFKIPKQNGSPQPPAGGVWTHPVVANGGLYLRDQKLDLLFRCFGQEYVLGPKVREGAQDAQEKSMAYRNRSNRWLGVLQCASFLCSLNLCTPLNGADWPQWRGPDRNDVSKETGLLKKWPKQGPQLLWTYKNAGTGYSAPALVGDRLYLLGARGGDEYVYAPGS